MLLNNRFDLLFATMLDFQVIFQGSHTSVALVAIFRGAVEHPFDILHLPANFLLRLVLNVKLHTKQLLVLRYRALDLRVTRLDLSLFSPGHLKFVKEELALVFDAAVLDIVLPISID